MASAGEQGAPEAEDVNEGPAASTTGVGIGAHLLGIFVIVHLAAVLLQAIPNPAIGLRRAAWRDPTVQQEFKVWADVFSISVDELQDRLWGIGKGFTSGRAVLVRPFRPYAKYIGVRQPWRMFVAPHRFPTALVIDVHEQDRWRIVYADRSPEYTWRVGYFGHDRMRAAIFRYGWPGYSGVYRGFSRWIATLAARDFPDARYVRVRMFRRRSPSPSEVREGTIPAGEYQQPQLFDLEKLR